MRGLLLPSPRPLCTRSRGALSHLQARHSRGPGPAPAARAPHAWQAPSAGRRASRL